MTRILLVAALGVEATPLIAMLSGRRRIGARLVTGHWLGREVGVLVCGVGPHKARARTTAALQRFDAERVLSAGTCGALVDELDIGDVVHAAWLGHADAPATPGLPLPLPGVRLVTVTRPVASRSARLSLAERGWEVCEMEAAAVAEAAAGRTVGAVKVVSDLAGRRADPALTAEALPSPVAIARFKARALRLCRDRLAPAVERCLSS